MSDETLAEIQSIKDTIEDLKTYKEELIRENRSAIINITESTANSSEKAPVNETEIKLIDEQIAGLQKEIEDLQSTGGKKPAPVISKEEAKELNSIPKELTNNETEAISTPQPQTEATANMSEG